MSTKMLAADIGHFRSFQDCAKDNESVRAHFRASSSLKAGLPMDAIAAIRTRRSVRTFLDRPLDPDLVAAILDDAARAAVSPNAAQGAWHFTVVMGRCRLDAYGNRALDFARRNRPQFRYYEWTERAGFSVFHGAPTAIVISGRVGLDCAREECTRAGQLLEIAAHARGIGTCWLISPMLWLCDALVRQELGIPRPWIPSVCFALGWPDEAARSLPPVFRPAYEISWIGRN